MAITADTIDHLTLEHLVEAGAVRGATVIGQPGGWGIVVQYDMTERVLAAKRGAVRIFRRFETLASYLKEIGIAQVQVDFSQFDPSADKKGRTRTDAAERMKKAHEAAAYTAWLTQEVQEAIDDPGLRVPHSEVVDEWLIERAELLKRVETGEI